jgi:hypothetical protein
VARLISSKDWDNLPELRERCKVLSEIWGFTVFPREWPGGCELVRQHSPYRIRDRLTGLMEVKQARTIVEWEIAKAEGRLRLAA